jgi:nitronate monooxygenase
MGGVARSELVAAVTEAGGFGFLGMVREPLDLMRSEVRALRERGVERFGVNLIPAATPPDHLMAHIACCVEMKVPVVTLFWDLATEAVRCFLDAGILVVCQVGSAAEALQAQQAGARIIIAQGREAGGHVRGDRPLDAVLTETVAAVDLPVLAAGGIADGQDLATVLALGAQGAVLGTALMASPESFAHDYHKQRLVTAKSADTLLTEAFHINWPRGAKVRVLANSVTRGEQGDPFTAPRKVIGDEEGRPIYLFSTDSPSRVMTGDFEAMALYAGVGVDRITDIVGAGERLRRIVDEATALVDPCLPPAVAEAAATASPVCYADEADDAYMGYASRAELLPILNELLEAERAGAQVALRTANETDDPLLKALVREIQRDEARWCSVLAKAVQRLGGRPSRQTGAFYGKAMAIADVNGRLAFLNRGQGWVVRRLTELLPKVRDDILHASLAGMLASHESNIGRIGAVLHAPDPA